MSWSMLGVQQLEWFTGCANLKCIGSLLHSLKSAQDQSYHTVFTYITVQVKHMYVIQYHL
jgi:hypothetical protein